MSGRKKTDPKAGPFKVINYFAAAGADAAASAAGAAAAGADAAAASVAAGAEAAAGAAAGAATSAAGAGAAASSFLLHATKAIANRDTNKSDFFI